MSIIRAIDIQFKRMEERGWDKIFYFFDLHETVIYPDYDNKHETKLYPYAKEVLQYLSKREDISISIYTCSYPEEIEKYMDFFIQNDIDFEYVNKNPEAKNTTYGYYEDKPYFNVLFDDKAGFDAENDWIEIAKYFNLINSDELFDYSLVK
jgi:hypothetical protein